VSELEAALSAAEAASGASASRALLLEQQLASTKDLQNASFKTNALLKEQLTEATAHQSEMSQQTEATVRNLRGSLADSTNRADHLQELLTDAAVNAAATADQLTQVESKRMLLSEENQAEKLTMQAGMRSLALQLENSVPLAEHDAALSTWQAEEERLHEQLQASAAQHIVALKTRSYRVAASARGETSVLLNKVASLFMQQLSKVDEIAIARLGRHESALSRVCSNIELLTAEMQRGASHSLFSMAEAQRTPEQRPAEAGVGKTPIYKQRSDRVSLYEGLLSPAPRQPSASAATAHDAPKTPTPHTSDWSTSSSSDGQEERLQKSNLYDKLQEMSTQVLRRKQEIVLLRTELKGYQQKAVAAAAAPISGASAPVTAMSSVYPNGTTLRLWDETTGRNVLVVPSDDIQPLDMLGRPPATPLSPSAGVEFAMVPVQQTATSGAPTFPVPPVAFAAIMKSKATCTRLLSDLAALKREHTRELAMRDLALTSLRGEALQDKADRIALERSFSSIQHESRMRAADDVLSQVSPGRASFFERRHSHTAGQTASSEGEALETHATYGSAHMRILGSTHLLATEAQGVNILEGLSSVGSLSSTDDEADGL
jgi:hypothetical protein